MFILPQQNKTFIMLESVAAKKSFQSTQVIYYALLAGQLLFATIIILVINQPTGAFKIELSDTFTLISVLATVSVLALSNFIYNRQIMRASHMDTLAQVLPHLTTTTILRAAPIEGVNLLNLVFLMMTNNPFFLLPFALGILIFLSVRPTIDLLRRDYNLGEDTLKLIS